MEIKSTEEQMEIHCSSQNSEISELNIVENNSSEINKGPFYIETMNTDSDFFNNEQILDESSSNSEITSSKCDTTEGTIPEIAKHSDTNTELNNIDETSSDTKNLNKKSNKLTILDSESEDSIDNFRISDTDTSNMNISKKKSNKIIDSDTEDESNLDINDQNENVVKTNQKQKIRSRLIDSDDESNDINTKNLDSDKESFSTSQDTFENKEQNKKKSRIKLCDTDSSDDEIIIKPSSEIQKSQSDIVFETEQNDILKSRLSRLCDSESSADEETNHDNYKESQQDEEMPWSYKKRKEKVERPKKMSGKEAAEQRKQIVSENQRMMRETRVSLPYHRAKSHTLEEFMKKRAQIPDIVRSTKSVPNHMNIKMNAKQLEIAAKQLEEREKVLDEFYKSDSEEENNDNKEENTEDCKRDEAELVKSIEKLNEIIKTDAVEHVRKNLFEEETEKLDEENADKDETQNLSTGSKESEIITETAEKSGETQSEGIKTAEDLTEEEILKIIEEREKEESTEKDCSEDSLKDFTLKESTSDLVEMEKENIPDKKIDTPHPKTNKVLERLKKLNPLLAMKTNFQPKITGNSSDVIILDDDVEKSRAINNLKKRFIAHNAMKPVHTKDESYIASVDTNILKHESASVLIDHDDEHRVTELIPGEKLKKLRKELEQQMAKKRLEQWEKSQQEMQQKKIEDEEMYDGEKEVCETVIDEEEEEEMTDSGNSDEEDEMEMDVEEKTKVKSAFVDDEAEESELEEEDEEDEDEDNEADNEDDVSSELGDDTQTKKPLKRIITAFSDDSDEDNELNETVKESINKIISSENNDIPSTDDEDDIPLYQIENLNKTPSRVPDTKSDLNLTPSLYLSALKGKSANNKMLESPLISLSLPNEPSPVRRHPGLKTKLFQSTESDSLSQAFDELESLCSGRFDEEPKSSNIEEDELLGLISGKFDGIKKLEEPRDEQSQMTFVDLTQISSESDKNEKIDLTKDSETNYVSFDFNEDSQDLKLTLEDNTVDKENKKEEKIDDIKKPLESVKGKLVIISSDDEVEEVTSPKKKKKTKKRKLDFSDDEESDEESGLEEESEKEYATLTNVEDINYDSEENEIEFDENEVFVPTEKVAKTFFENEAELSESEWGSADEDEKDLDQMDREEGDEEQYNEGKLQKELGKIHMRQVMDQDSREVRLLQELLLEDGELHGAGRERKFKWKNADSETWKDSEQPKDDDEEADEIESELQWRKMRHEREVFLEEQRKKVLASTDEVELLTTDSQLMKSGQEALKKSIDTTVQSKTIVPPNIEGDKTFSLLTKCSFRGSFLTRSENTLTRIAEMAKVSSKEIVPGTKNSRNFVFTSVTKTEEITVEIGEKSEKKRKATDGTPKVLKKMRIAENSPSGVRSKKSLKTAFGQN